MGLLQRLLARAKNDQLGDNSRSSGSSKAAGPRSLSRVLELVVAHARTLQVILGWWLMWLDILWVGRG
jgi:hypothetical protein